MSTIKLSKTAALKVIRYSEEMFEELNSNTKQLNDQIVAHMLNLKDPVATTKHMELMQLLEDELKHIGMTVEDITQYCESMIRWIDTMEAY